MSRVVIKNVRLSYANIWEQKQMQGDTNGKMRYSASLLISKDDTKTLKANASRRRSRARQSSPTRMVSFRRISNSRCVMATRIGRTMMRTPDATSSTRTQARIIRPRLSIGALSPFWIARRYIPGAMPTSASHSLRSTRRAMSVSAVVSATSRRYAMAII